MYEVYRGPSNVSVRALFAVPAYGLMRPPMIIYPCKKIAAEIT